MEKKISSKKQIWALFLLVKIIYPHKYFSGLRMAIANKKYFPNKNKT